MTTITLGATFCRIRTLRPTTARKRVKPGLRGDNRSASGSDVFTEMVPVSRALAQDPFMILCASFTFRVPGAVPVSGQGIASATHLWNQHTVTISDTALCAEFFFLLRAPLWFQAKGVGSEVWDMPTLSEFESERHSLVFHVARKENSSDETLEETHTKPWFVAPVLLLAVLAVSSAGAVTKSMVGAAAITTAGWRLQVTSFILLPGFLWQWLRLSKAMRERTMESTNLVILGMSGVALALHFGLWVWSVYHTSLAHSLLFVSTPPIVVAVLSYLQAQPLSRGEVNGVALGMGGVVIIAAGSRVEKDNEVTLLGDLAAFAAAVAFVVYISAGRHLRGWMPLYVYAFPVTAISAFLLALGGIGLEGLKVSSSGEICGPFGWVREEYWLPTLFLAFGPGFVGHTGLNACLRYLPSLVIAMAITLEPPLGTGLGWLLGLASTPGIWTCVGGVMLLLGTLWVNYASEQRKVKLCGDEDEDEDGRGSLTS